MVPMSYKKLDVWQLARELVIEIHDMTIKRLPKFEVYEEENQIRGSVKISALSGGASWRFQQKMIEL